MNRGEIYRVEVPAAERGDKPGFYVVVSRQFIAGHERVSTVVCAPVYGEVLGLDTEVLVGPDEGLPRTSAIRCDFLALVFKSRLRERVGAIRGERAREVDAALAKALDLPLPLP